LSNHREQLREELADLETWAEDNRRWKEQLESEEAAYQAAKAEQAERLAEEKAAADEAKIETLEAE
jgi:hypothetical protein